MIRFPLLLATLLLTAPAFAAESLPLSDARVVATLVSRTDAVTPGQPLRVGLKLRMAPGWHTYWRNPGSAGAAADFAFTLPAGVRAGEIDWPTPQRQPEGELLTYGYSGTVLLPVSLTGATGATSVTLHASFLVCAQVCEPYDHSFSLDLPAGMPAPMPTPSGDAPLFARTEAATPRPLPWTAHVAPDGALVVHGHEITTGTVRDAWFMPDQPDRLNDAARQAVTVTAGRLRLALVSAKGAPAAAALSGVLVVRDGAGQESAFQVNAPPGPAEAAASGRAWWRVLLLAFAGGLILNVMPCVFPVLAMKAAALTRHAPRPVIGAACYALGTMATFCTIALVLVGLRAAGGVTGWGFQFQMPAFVAATGWLMFAVGLNLSGVFALGGAGSGAGQGWAARGGLIGQFATGALAVLVASPCTAPFMAAAIAAGLAAPWWLTIVVFACMGAGLALPYVAIAVLPAARRALPRPGPWMELLRQALAFPMYATTAWLAWVVSQEAGPDGVLAVGAGLVLVGFIAWVAGRAQSAGSRRAWRAAGLLGLAAALAGVALLVGLQPSAAAQVEAVGFERFSERRLAELRQQGKPVLTDMTAAWCITCLVNERVALGAATVRDALRQSGTVLLRGDWTRQDPEITAYLRAHDRDGVPLYVFYPAGRPGVVLPQILTPGLVLAALR